MIKKQGSPPANTQIIAPGAELPKPRQKKPHEVEADNPESAFTHDEVVPMIDFGAGAGYTVRNPIRKQDSLQRDAEIVEVPGQSICRGRSQAFDQRFAIHVDVNLAQARGRHRHQMYGKRVEQFVGEDHASTGVGQVGR